MSDSLSKSGFGDAALAERVLKSYVESVDEFTQENCDKLGLTNPYIQKCDPLAILFTKYHSGERFDDDRYFLASALRQLKSKARMAIPYLERMRDNDPIENCRDAAKDALKQIQKGIL